MNDAARCDVCQSVLEELRTALSEIRESPGLRDQMRADVQTLLTLGKEEGADAALHRFRFRADPLGPVVSRPRYSGIVEAIRKINEHKNRTGHTVVVLPG